MGWAEAQFRLDKRNRDGTTQREAFASYERQTGRKHHEDKAPDDPPAALRYLYAWFHEIGAGRPLSGGSLLMLPSTEIDAWARLRRVVLDDWELDAIRSLDSTYVRVMGSEE